MYRMTEKTGGGCTDTQYPRQKHFSDTANIFISVRNRRHDFLYQLIKFQIYPLSSKKPRLTGAFTALFFYKLFRSLRNVFSAETELFKQVKSRTAVTEFIVNADSFNRCGAFLTEYGAYCLA